MKTKHKIGHRSCVFEIFGTVQVVCFLFFKTKKINKKKHFKKQNARYFFGKINKNN